MPSKKRKGQYLIIEEVLLFLIGTLLIGGIIFMNSSFRKSTSDFFVGEESDLIINELELVTLMLDQMNVSGSVALNIPNKLHDKKYILYQNGTKRDEIILSDEDFHFQKRYKLNRNITLSQVFESDTEYFLVQKNKTSITGRGVYNY